MGQITGKLQKEANVIYFTSDHYSTVFRTKLGNKAQIELLENYDFVQKSQMFQSSSGVTDHTLICKGIHANKDLDSVSTASGLIREHSDREKSSWCANYELPSL